LTQVNDGASLASLTWELPCLRCQHTIKLQHFAAHQSKHNPRCHPLYGMPVHAVLLPRQAIPGMPEVFAFLHKPNMLLMKNFLSAFKFTLPALLVAGVFYLFATNGGYEPLFKADSENVTSLTQKTEATLPPPPCA